METAVKLKPHQQKKGKFAIYTFLIALGVASIIFLPFIIYDKGYFTFYGDFNVQQIPFYQYCHEQIRSGNIMWSFETDLGSNFLGSYSFYMLGSPFFWITLLFPNWLVPHLMGPLLILKFACAALTAFLFIRRFTARPQTAMFGGLLYAFCGFSVYNIFFNHFHEAIVFFPLLLLALEKTMAEKKHGYMTLAVFICALSNYFFFYGMVLFVAIYWLVKTFSGCWKFNLKTFLLLAFECVLGLAMTAILLWPTYLMVTGNTRLGEYITGWSAVLYGKEQIFLNIIQCFFFPPDLPARPVFFPGAEVRWSSLGGWLPLVGMVGVIAWLQSAKKGHWIRRLLFIMIFMALVPGLNSAFYLLNYAYYARWFFMPILIMCLATVMAVEDSEVNLNSAWRWNFGITTAFCLVIGLSPKEFDDNKFAGLGLYNDATTNPFKWVYQVIRHLLDRTYKITEWTTSDIRFWVTCLIAILSLVAFKFLIPLIKQKKFEFVKIAIPLVCAVSIIYSCFYIASGKSHSFERDVVVGECIEYDLDLPDDEEYRVDVYEGMDNMGLFLGQSSINFFHSIVSPTIPEFYNYVSVERGVGSRPSVDYNGLRALLSVKYMLDPIIDGTKDFGGENGTTLIPGFSYYKTQSDTTYGTDENGNVIVLNEVGYVIYKNDYFIPFGFTYDYYMTDEQCEQYSGTRRTQMMLKAMLLNDEQAEKYDGILTFLEEDYNVTQHNYDIPTPDFSNNGYYNDCNNRAKNASYYYKQEKNSFTSKIELYKENLVFFSVPYDDGWTAYVNGQPAEIEKVNVGFMAVLAPKGDNEIKFVYETPGLKTGIYVSVGAVCVFLVFVIIVFIYNKKKSGNPPEYPEGEQLKKRFKEYLEDRNEEDLFAINENLLDDIEIDSAALYNGFEGGFKLDDEFLQNISNDEMNNQHTFSEENSNYLDELEDFKISEIVKPKLAEKIETEPAKTAEPEQKTEKAEAEQTKTAEQVEPAKTAEPEQTEKPE